MPGTPLEVEYPTFELLADRSIPTAAGCVIWLLFFSSDCVWLELTEVGRETFQLQCSLFRPCLERCIPHDMLSNLIIFYWFQYSFSVGNTSPYWNKVGSYFRFMQTLIYRCRSARWSTTSDPPKKTFVWRPPVILCPRQLPMSPMPRAGPGW